MSRQYTDHEGRRESIVQQLLAIITGMIGSLLALAVAQIAASVLNLWIALPSWVRSWWFNLIIAIIFFIILTIISKNIIIIRRWRLLIFKEVSSSKCNEYFIKVAMQYFRHYKSKEKVLLALENIVQYRKYPNERLLSILRTLLQNLNLLSYSDKEKILLYLKALSQRAEIREQLIQNVIKFLRKDFLTSDTYLVLYGYSTSVCESLVSLREELVANGIIDQNDKYLPCPVFLVQDLQYGTEGSLNEHIRVQKYLEKGLITPIILPFDRLPLLFSTSADFLYDAVGRLVALSRKRRILGIVGCEVSDIRGNVWIPSQVRGRPSETAKFVEEFCQSKLMADSTPLETLLVAVTESYKIYRHITEGDAFTFVPIRTSMLLNLLYLLGFYRKHPSMKVELVKLDPSQLYAIIDDFGEHRSNGKNINLWFSLDEWEKLTIRKVFPEVHRVDLRTMLASKTFIFDFSGVLAADVFEQFSAFKSVVVEELRATLDYSEYIRTYFGLPDMEAIRKLVEDKAPSGDFDAALISKRKKYQAQFSTDEIPAIPEAIELARDLYRDGKNCYLVTTSSQSDVDKFIDRYKLNEVFPAKVRYYLADSINLRKIYMDIIRASDDDPTKCVLIDIALWHLILARELGIGTISFATSRAVIRSEVDALVRGAKELRDEYIELTTPVIEQGGVLNE